MLWTHAAAALAALAIGFASGWKVEAWRRDSIALAEERENARVAVRRADHADRAGVNYEAKRAAGQEATRVILREVERVVQSPVYLDRCLDDDGLRLVAAAVAAAPDPGQPASAVPAASAPR